MNELHLFAGIGGGILAGTLLGHRPVGAVEIDPFARRVLEARQADGCLPSFPIHDDVTTFDAVPFRGVADVVAGGFPCQDISTAGKGAGLDGERSGLWWEMHRVVREVEPRFVFVENVPALLVRGFDRVLGSLADLGFDAEWCVLSAADCGAPHLRKRLWLLAGHPDRIVSQHARAESEVSGGAAADSGRVRDAADAERVGLRQQPEPVAGREGSPIAVHDGATGDARASSDGPQRASCRPSSGGHATGRDEPAGVCRTYPDADGWGCEGQWFAEPAGLEGARRRFVDGFREARQQQHPAAADAATGGGWWSAEPDVGRVAHGVPDRVGRLRGLGNAQVPVVAARAFRHLMGRLMQGVRS